MFVMNVAMCQDITSKLPCAGTQSFSFDAIATVEPSLKFNTTVRV